MFTPILGLHIPDGFLSIPVSIVGWALMILLIGISLRQTRGQFNERQIPLMGIIGACIFAGQMLNFPVAGGTSGHLIGAILAAILLGPYAAVLVMTVVVGIQAFLFQDGGLLALGFNVFNMGIVAAFVGYAVYTWAWRLLGGGTTAQFVATGIAAWLGVVIAAAVTALQLAVSGTSPLNIALPAMIGIHILIGIGEALITVAAVVFVRQTRADLLTTGTTQTASRGSSWIAAGLVIAIALAFLSPLASSHPDGLEFVAEEAGFLGLAQDPTYEIMPDYTVPFIEDAAATTIVAGIIGVLIVAVVSAGVAVLSRRDV